MNSNGLLLKILAHRRLRNAMAAFAALALVPAVLTTLQPTLAISQECKDKEKDKDKDKGEGSKTNSAGRK